MTTPNNLLIESEEGFVVFDETVKRWDAVKDAVDYPVWITPAYYLDEDKNEFVNANGQTNTGRDKNFCLVVVDKFRDDNRQVIATVSDMYGSLETKTVYHNLQQELILSETAHKVEQLFVSGNGGMHQLTIKLSDMLSLDGVPDDLSMLIRLETSVDGTTAHSLSMIVHNNTGDTDIHVYGGNYTLSARHTKTIGDRSAYYIPTIQTMIDNWNDVVIPTMSLMYDQKFNRGVALELLSGICEDSKIGKRHIANISQLYTSESVKTKDTTDSLYRINMTINQYFDDELNDMNDTKQKFKDNITRSIQKQLNKLQK